jgi:regulatory protein
LIDTAVPDAAGQLAGDALRLLARREHSRRELERKLAARQADPELVEQVLDQLEQRALLSDARFVEAYVAQRVRKGYGPLRIRAELSERGIEGGLVARAFEQGAFDWDALLDELIGRRFGDTPAADSTELARRARFLSARGFPADLVGRRVNRMRHP